MILRDGNAEASATVRDQFGHETLTHQNVLHTEPDPIAWIRSRQKRIGWHDPIRSMNIARRYGYCEMRILKYIYIVDLLSTNERSCDQETASLERLVSGKLITARYEIDTKAQLIDLLKSLKASASPDPTMLHIAAHGACVPSDPAHRAVGLAVSNEGSYIEWNALRDLFTDLNTATGDNLLINVMACRGANAFKTDDFFGDNAFHAILGPAEDISPSEAYAITNEFYAKVIAGTLSYVEMSDHVTEINKARNKIALNVVTANFLKERAQQLKMGAAPNLPPTP